jgi:HEAT repeat protein
MSMLVTNLGEERRVSRDPQSVSLLSEILYAGNTDVRKLGLLALYQLGPDAAGAVGAIKDRLLDLDPVVRRMAQNALYKAGFSPD